MFLDGGHPLVRVLTILAAFIILRMQRIQWFELVVILSDYIFVEKCNTFVSDSLLYFLI